MEETIVRYRNKSGVGAWNYTDMPFDRIRDDLEATLIKDDGAYYRGADLKRLHPASNITRLNFVKETSVEMSEVRQ